MATRTIEVWQIADTVNEYVTTWTAAVVSLIDRAQVKTIKDAKAFAKKETPESSKSGSTNKKDENPYIDLYVQRSSSRQHWRALWNKKYPLSHLLEDGHEVHNQSGGPYEIKNRVADTTANKNAKVTSSDETTQFDMWDETFEDFDVEKVYVDYIKEFLSELL